MTATDVIFAFLRTLRDATNLIKARSELRLDDIIALTKTMNDLSSMEPSKFDISALQLKIECAGCDLYGELAAKVVGESSSFIEAYEARQDELDGQCSSSNVHQLIYDHADKKVHFKKESAAAALKKQHAIFDKYNDITRIYNSMDMRRGREEEDMGIIRQFER